MRDPSREWVSEGWTKIGLGTLWLALPTLLTLLFVWTLVDFPIDFWHRIGSGRLIWTSGTLAGQDVFTHTIVGREIVNQNWLAELSLFGLFQLGGFPLVQCVAGLCYAASLGTITYLAQYRGGHPRVAAALGLAALALSASNLGIRTQMFSAVLFALELLALWRWPDRWYTVGIVALVELLWTNMHGAFPLGVVLPGLFLLGTAWQVGRHGGNRTLFADRTLRCYLIATLAAFGMMFCNPHPERTIDYVLGVASKSSARGIEEWLPTATSSYAGMAFAISVLVVVAFLMIGRKRLDMVQVLLILAFVVLGARAQRMVVWWAMVMPVVIAPQVAVLFGSRQTTSELPEERSRLNFVILLLFAAFVLMSSPWARCSHPLLPAAKRVVHPIDEPRAVVMFLEEGGYSGRAFNTMEWGGYISWHLHPDLKVFIDPRIDFFPDEVWEDYVRIGKVSPGWKETLDLYQVDLVIWNRQVSETLPGELEASPLWKNVYRDTLATVYVRVASLP